jgi:putative ATP-binding cassette transporter
VELRGLMARFEALAANWWLLMQRYKLLTALTSGYGQVASVFPIVVAAPRYFAGLVPLGVLVQTAGAFGSVQGALSWFVDTYADLASFRATVQRLATFRRAIEEAHTVASSGLQSLPGEACCYDMRGVSIALPEGREILRSTDLMLRPGDTLLLTGPSGCGKSTLLRALAGIWPFGRGHVVRPSGRVMFLPQRPYIPLGTLRQAVSYPASADAYPHEAVADALRAAGLGTLLDRLDDQENWHLRLSGGEQQRLAIARALLARPDWLLLDEATASLDPASGEELYAMLRQRLPGMAIVSVAHLPAVARFHQRRVQLQHGTGGVTDVFETEAAPA